VTSKNIGTCKNGELEMAQAEGGGRRELYVPGLVITVRGSNPDYN